MDNIDLGYLSDEALARYARTRHAFVRMVKPLPKSRTLERGASHVISTVDGEVTVDHAGCANRDIPQLHSARKRGVYHRERSRGYLRFR